MRYLFSFICHCILLLNILAQENPQDEENTFVATNEWQVVRPDQVLPPGLHVQMSMVTGERQARLMQENDRSMEENEAVVLLEGEMEEQLETNEELETVETPSEDKEPVITIKNDKADRLNQDDLSNKQQALREEAKRQRNEAALQPWKKALYDPDSTVVVASLQQLVDELHDVDKAEEFAGFSGFKLLLDIISGSNHTTHQKILSFQAIGSAVQSNDGLQNQVADQNGIKIIKEFLMQEILSNEEDCKPLLYCLGSLVRGNSAIQKAFILEHDGISYLHEIFTKANDFKTKLKIITLVSDILTFQKYEGLPTSESYSQWCEHGISLFISSDNSNFREKSLRATGELMAFCRKDFSNYKNVLLFKEKLSLYQKEILSQLDGETDAEWRDFLDSILVIIKDVRVHFDLPENKVEL